ncbi:MAG TPA: stage II sporulation protein E, partial [Peptostreptococcaceae bacterium]|nr:stage II sporulation protein E [Peptostreptococcaceae bacterium]
MQKSIAINTKGTLKVKDFPKLNQINSTVIILSLIGFLLSRAVIVDTVAPLGIAYYLYISRVKKYSIPVFLSVALGIMSTGNIGPHTIKYMA